MNRKENAVARNAMYAHNDLARTAHVRLLYVAKRRRDEARERMAAVGCYALIAVLSVLIFSGVMS